MIEISDIKSQLTYENGATIKKITQIISNLKLVDTFIFSSYFIFFIPQISNKLFLIIFFFVLINLSGNINRTISILFIAISLLALVELSRYRFTSIHTIFISNIGAIFAVVCIGLALLVNKVRPRINLETGVISNQISNLILGSFALVSWVFIANLKLSSQTAASALRFLNYLGEDNAAWLNAMSSAAANQSVDIKPTTRAVFDLLEPLFASGRLDLVPFENALILQRIYIFLMLLGSLIVIHFVILLAQRNSYSIPLTAVTAFLAGSSTFLGFASFVEYGHLTPIISACLIFAFINYSFELTSIQNNFSIIHGLHLLIMCLMLWASANAWYPIKPALYLTIGLFLFFEIYSKYLVKINFQKFIFGLVPLISLIILIFYIFENSIWQTYKRLGTLVHIQGGTHVPGIAQQYLLFFFIGAFLFTQIEKSIRGQIFYIKLLIATLLFYYLFIIGISTFTAPHTIEYATHKLSMFILVICIPIEISALSFFLRNKKNQLGTSTFFLTFISILGLTAGAPTSSPENPGYSQIAFPYGIFSRISNEDTYFWEGAVIEEISNNHDKRILCFDANGVSPAYSCSKFASALQGFYDEPFMRFWLQVNLNAVSSSEFKERIPRDFYSKYSFIYLDEIIGITDSNNLNTINPLIPRK